MKNIAYFFVIAIGIVLTLIYGQTMLIQLIIAFLLWFATVQIKKTFHNIKWFKRFVPNILQSLTIAGFLILGIYLVMGLVMNNLSELTASFGIYEQNINTITVKIEKVFNIDAKEEFNAMINSLNIKNILSNLAESLSSILSNFMMILIYLLFIFLETSSIKLKFKALFPNTDSRKQFDKILDKMEISLAKYFRVKTLMSLLTGFLSFIVLKIVGVDAAIFWAFLIFLLNYIPTIGSLIATVFPAVFSLLQFGTFPPFAIIIVSVGAVQMFVGNFVEPRLMGKTLNVSPLVTIVALAVWGQLWGIIGMLLSVPITVIMIIILSQFKNTQNAAIILSEKGEL